MKQCPRCHELIGDSHTVCPCCKTEFTEKQLEEMRKALDNYDLQKQIDERNKLIRLRKKRVISKWIILPGLALLLSSPMFFFNKAVGFGVLIAGGVLMVGGFLFALISGALACPFCGTLQGRALGPYCTRCGKLIYVDIVKVKNSRNEKR